MSNATPPGPDRPTGGTGGGSAGGSGSGPSGSGPYGSGASGSGASGSGASGKAPSEPPSPGSAAAGGSGRSAADTPGAGAEVKRPTPFTQQLGRITIVVLAALFAVFAIVNSQPVDFSWVFGETIARDGADGEVMGGVPLILLLVGAFVAGALITFLTELYVGRARRARKAAKERAEQEGGKDRKGRGDRT